MTTAIPYVGSLGVSAARATPGPYKRGLGPGAAAMCDSVVSIRPARGAYSKRDVLGSPCGNETSAYAKQGAITVEPVYLSVDGTLKVTDYVSLGNFENMRENLGTAQSDSGYFAQTYTPDSVTGGLAIWSPTKLGVARVAAEINAFNTKTLGIRLRLTSLINSSVAGTYVIATDGWVLPDAKSYGLGAYVPANPASVDRALTLELTGPEAAVEIWVPWAFEIDGKEGHECLGVATIAEDEPPLAMITVGGIQTNTAVVLDFIVRGSPYAAELLQGGVLGRSA